jgi:hypothetical protein
VKKLGRVVADESPNVSGTRRYVSVGRIAKLERGEGQKCTTYNTTSKKRGVKEGTSASTSPKTTK